MPASTSSPGARATAREWIGLAVIALPCLVYAMDMTVLNLALPAIAADLAPSSSQLLWIIDIYGFLVAGFLITMGNLGDRIGRRRLLLIGGAAFAAASAIAAFSSSAEMLIAMRALLGVAGATLAPSTMSLIRNMFHDERERQFAIGVWIASFSLGSAIGPLVGGVLLQLFGWGSVFLAAVPVMILLLVLGPALLPEYRDPDAGPIDPLSVVLSLVAVLSAVYGLKQVAELGPKPFAVSMLLIGVTVGVAFVRRQGRLAHPLLDLHLFRNARFSAAIVAYGLSCLAMFGTYIFITQYLQGVLGLAPLHAGLATVPWSLAFLGGSLVASWLARRLSAASVLVWGLVAAALGFGGVTLAIGDHALAVLVGATVLMSLGMAPAITIGNEMMITAAPPERAGAASALAETCAEFSGAFGVALFGSFGMALYRASLSGSMPAGLGPDAASMALATLGGAVAVARDAPPVLGAMLLDAARSSFTDAMRLNAAVGAAILLAAAGVAACILRRPAEAGRMQPPGRASSGGHRRRPARRAAPAERAGSRETP